jgi:competence protein ComEC
LFITVAALSTFLRVKELPQGISSGTILAEVIDRRLTTFHKKPFWHVSLYVHDFSTSDRRRIARGICLPVTIVPPCGLIGGCVYELPATAFVDGSSRIMLRPILSKELKIVKHTFSFVEWRVWLRKVLERVFVGLFSDEAVRHVAGALTFGLYKDSSLQQAMHRAGVEHVLAISGFHFGIVAALTVYCMGIVSSRLRSAVAMVLLTIYLLIVGPLPSVIRAWCAAMMVLGGVFIHRTASGLNCLGVGLIASVFYNPSFVMHIGFQLSFLATAAILFFSRTVFEQLQAFFPIRSIGVLEYFSFIDQVLLGVLRWSLPLFSLIIPVSVVIIPYQMAFLQDFSSLGCLYNLFIPALFSFAMPAILIAVLVHPCHILGIFFSMVAEPFLRVGLVLVNNIPENSWTLISGGGIPPYIGRMTILSFLILGIFSEGTRTSERTEAWKACL